MIRPLIFGEVLFDDFPDGSRVLGGAPFNVAWNLQALGARPLLISRVGNDALGRSIREQMQHWGMDLSAMQLDSAHPTGTVEVRIDDGEPSYEIVAPCAYDFIRFD
ncbi:MAG: carbohydrate kinase, partial [Candidatus Sedimenticola endophacoides]